MAPMALSYPGLASGGLGVSVSTASDINGDGISDLVLGANNANSGFGASYVIFGKFPLTLETNQLTVTQGSSVILGKENLYLVDMNHFSADKLYFSISDLQGGRFRFVNNSKNAIKNFTQQAILGNQIEFVQDGSRKASYSVSGSNGYVSRNFGYANVILLNPDYHPPVVTHPLENQTIWINDFFKIQIPNDTFVDPDEEFSSNEFIYSAKQSNDKPLPDWMEFNNQSRFFSGKPTTLGTNRFSLFAANPKNLSAKTNTNFTLSVVDNNVPTAPTVPPVVVGVISGLLGCFSLLGVGYCAAKKCFKNDDITATEKTELLSHENASINNINPMPPMQFTNYTELNFFKIS